MVKPKTKLWLCIVSFHTLYKKPNHDKKFYPLRVAATAKPKGT